MKPPITWESHSGQSLKIRLKVWYWNNIVNPIVWSGFWLTRIDPVISWCERVIYCHHNARVIADFEHRMAVVLCECTRGMSKPYYTAEAMVGEINSYINERCQDAYDEGYHDAQSEADLVPEELRGALPEEIEELFVQATTSPTICPTCTTRWLWSPSDDKCYACGHGFEVNHG